LYYQGQGLDDKHVVDSSFFWLSLGGTQWDFCCCWTEVKQALLWWDETLFVAVNPLVSLFLWVLEVLLFGITQESPAMVTYVVLLCPCLSPHPWGGWKGSQEYSLHTLYSSVWSLLHVSVWLPESTGS
jgi:hypothetical protein